MEPLRSHSQLVCYLDIGATLSVSATSSLMLHSLFYVTEYLQVMVLHDSTAGRCCLYRAKGCNEEPNSYVKCTIVQGWESNTIAIASRWPWIVTHGGAKGRAISLYSMPWPLPCSGALTTGCFLEAVALPAFIEDATFREVDSGVCREPLACWPSCRMEQSIHYHVSEQQTSAYSGSTSCY